jgi:aryl-alcohol dehydrogenase-like predicted oxidoreductase
MDNQKHMSRRNFARTTLFAAAASIIPGLIQCKKIKTRETDDTDPRVYPTPMKRVFGKLGFEVTTVGLGGQASLQWTPEGIDPVKIIHKALDAGVNYFDTSNFYGRSQSNYGKAFRLRNLIPGDSNYDEKLRQSIFITSKTHLRYAKSNGNVDGVNNGTNGPSGSYTIDDLRRSISLMFGDGNGNYPQGAYLDMFLIHNLSTRREVDAVYEGLEDTDPNAERIGALAALRDYRDGTNLTGLNPSNEILIRHIGFSGHFDPSVNMYMIQRDHSNLLDAMLIPINANDKQMFNMQYNVIPVASAKNMGIIAMKVFADGAMYTKPAEWSSSPDHVVQTVGSESLPSQQLIKYTLTTAGVHLAIIGIGRISAKDEECQLLSNVAAGQILPEGLTESERSEIEGMANNVKSGRTNYFQSGTTALRAPVELSVMQNTENNSRNVTLYWTTGYAGDAPITNYEIWRDGVRLEEIQYTPQITLDPFSYSEILNDDSMHTYIVKVVDGKSRTAESAPVICPEITT